MGRPEDLWSMLSALAESAKAEVVAEAPPSSGAEFEVRGSPLKKMKLAQGAAGKTKAKTLAAKIAGSKKKAKNQ